MPPCSARTVNSPRKNSTTTPPRVSVRSSPPPAPPPAADQTRARPQHRDGICPTAGSPTPWPPACSARRSDQSQWCVVSLVIRCQATSGNEAFGEQEDAEDDHRGCCEMGDGPVGGRPGGQELPRR